jgi:predicted HTH transcriptional regulator
MVPESDILSRADNRRLLLLMVGLGLVLVSAGFAFWIFRRDTRALEDKMRDVFDEDNPVASIHSLISRGEGRSIEFKATMRMNLHTQKPGKEIELAWLKGVSALLNTDGGTLLLGVADDGQISGLERDVFENSDKCQLHFKNLVSRHIGAELSKYIRFIVVPMSVTVSTEKDQKTVGVVLCSRSSEPVFLKNNDKESFYIRNGPASDELAISKALKYIKHRK